MTAALAAVLALSSVPSLAQTVGEPVVTSTPPVDAAPTPVAADPIAPAPVVAEPIASPRAATTRKATAARTPAARARPPVRAATTARAAAPAAPAAPIAAPVAEAPAVQTLPPESVAVAPVASAPVTKAPATTIDLLPTAALGALGLLVLLGGALLVRSRRRRRLDEIEEREWQQAAEAEAAAEPEPVTIVEPEVEPALAGPTFVAAAATAPTTTQFTEGESDTKFIGPETELSDDFDLSRFGPNVQDAYRGPTEDNPSASLKQRLRRANGMDQQERKLDAEVEAVTGESVLGESDDTPTADTPAATSPAAPAKGDFIFARGNQKPGASPALRPSKVN
jgi:hypothetical protein